MTNILYRKLFWNALFIANLYAIFFVWFLGSSDLLTSGGVGDWAIAYGRLTGLLLEFLILIELVLVSRLRPLEQLYGFDKKNILHRRLGYFLVGFMFLHPLFLVWGYASRGGRSLMAQCLSFFTDWPDVLAATIALGILLAVGVLSMPAVRKALSYETWYFAHLPLYGAVGLAFGHQTQSGDLAYGGAMYYWLTLNFAVFGAVLAYRFLVPLWKNVRHGFRVARIVREADDVVSVYITGSRMEHFHFDPGQWARLIFFQKDMWQGHPFSFSAPFDGKELRFSIKALGDWTRRVDDLRPGIRVWLEGPYGALTLKKAVTNKQLFIAGGVGITPLLAMIRSLKKGADAALYYAARSRKDLLFKDEIRASGIPYRCFLSAEQCEGYETGTVSIDHIRALSPDFLSRDVYLCGPVPMLSSLTKALLGAGLPREQLHVERFGL